MIKWAVEAGVSTFYLLRYCFPPQLLLLIRQSLRNACCRCSGVKHGTFLASFANDLQLAAARERGRSAKHVKVVAVWCGAVRCGVCWDQFACCLFIVGSRI
jgi:hypothetical protein